MNGKGFHMAEPRSRSNRKRAGKAKAVIHEPAATPDDNPMVPAETVVARARDDMGGRLAIVLATGGLAFVGFLTVLLVIAASRA
jgi:hypothetical protein